LLTPDQVAALLLLKDEKDKSSKGIPPFVEKPLELQKALLSMLAIEKKEKFEIIQLLGGLSLAKDKGWFNGTLTTAFESLETPVEKVTGQT
jgi:hypothetical protein